MTLHESTDRLNSCCHSQDLDALSTTMWDRARALAEFAAVAPLEDLLEARAAGELCMQKLRQTRSEILTEMMQARKFLQTLELGAGFSRTRVEPNRLLG